MKHEWIPISSEREKEWMYLASGMLQGILFEYYPQKDYMVYTKYQQGGFHMEKRIENYFSCARKSVHPEDMGELNHLMGQIRKQKPQIYAELRLCFDDKTPDRYQLGTIQGTSVFGADGKLLKITGQMCRMREQWKEKQKLYNEAKKDSMTLLWNHKYTMEYIKDYLEYDGAKGSFFIIDVDNFKKINDTMGHLFGDQVILAVSRVLLNTFRSTDIIGRMGGDEFVVFMKNETAKELIWHKCNEICAAIGKVYCGEQIYKMSASIGVSRYPENGHTYEELLEKADKALYYVKGSGKNNSAIYEKNMAKLEACGRRTDSHVQDSLYVDGEDTDYDDFYYEITELTFRLMGDTTDVDSAISLLLHKLRDYFGFDVVSIREVVKEKPRTLQYLYEVHSDNISGHINNSMQYTETEWMMLLISMEQGRYLFGRENRKADLLFPGYENVSGIRLPLGSRKYFTAVVDYLFVDREHEWEEKEIRFLESFSRILAVYLTKIKTLDEASFLATMMQERDSVTGLYSYGKFLERMKEITLVKPDGMELCYIYSDISHFKYINETYGYETGDLVLRKFAEFLLSNTESNVLCVARVHSDNIVMTIKNEGGFSVQEITSSIDEQNEKISAVLRDYVHDKMIGIHSGLFLTADKKLPVEEAVSNAAYACKESKKQNHYKCRVFNDELMREYKQQLRFLSELQGAIDHKELTVYIQPKMMADGKTVAGGEALVRWVKKGNEMIYPDEFIPVFEKSGAIVDVDFFVYREVFSYLRRRLDQGLVVVPISMNVSRVHLNNDRMTDYVGRLFEEYQIDPSLVEFELTESIYIENMEQAARLVSNLQGKGVTVSMDDFGSGYSSLNMLSGLPIHVMKVDRIFLNKTSEKASDRIILECVVNMARKLKMSVICEGVETREQYEFLKEMGCDIMQGYYFGKPMPMEAFDKFLEERKSKMPEADTGTGMERRICIV